MVQVVGALENQKLMHGKGLLSKNITAALRSILSRIATSTYFDARVIISIIYLAFIK